MDWLVDVTESSVDCTVDDVTTELLSMSLALAEDGAGKEEEEEEEEEYACAGRT